MPSEFHNCYLRGGGGGVLLTYGSKSLPKLLQALPYMFRNEEKMFYISCEIDQCFRVEIHFDLGHLHASYL